MAAKALVTAKDMGLWVWNRLHYRTYVMSDGTQAERRHRPGNRYEMWNMYIAGEVGGMAESLARLSEMTGTAEEKARLLEAANYFDSPAFFDPLSKNIDAIRTRHANQHIPMVTGALRTFRGNANPYYYHLAENFWSMIQGRYRYAMGGVGNGEMFRQPWGNETPQSSCCGGTGAENHVKYQEAAYFANDSTIWVALYMPTTARWEQQHVIIRQKCQWPAERSVITVQPSSRSLPSVFAMKLRVPYWATEGFDIKLNGNSITLPPTPGTYVEIPLRRWTEHDTVEVVMPFTRHIDFGPDKIDGQWLGAFMRGPLVMAATGITSWDEATVPVNTDLATFIPDYDGDQHLTHYFRINIPASPVRSLVSDALPVAIDKSQLRELLLIVQSRVDEQQAWNALEVKVPEYAPWAVHGFARMLEQYENARPYMDAPDDMYTQEQIDQVASSLNAAINMMRPGNLPELEDLEELQQLLQQASLLPDDNQQANRAISYARMVMRYVSDGSGTMDMIQRAANQLREVLRY